MAIGSFFSFTSMSVDSVTILHQFWALYIPSPQSQSWRYPCFCGCFISHRGFDWPKGLASAMRDTICAAVWSRGLCALTHPEDGLENVIYKRPASDSEPINGGSCRIWIMTIILRFWVSQWSWLNWKKCLFSPLCTPPESYKIDVSGKFNCSRNYKSAANVSK